MTTASLNDPNLANALSRELKARRSQQARQELTDTLTHAVEEMRKGGASDKSIHIALTGLFEFLKVTRKPDKPDHPGPTQQAPGLFLSDIPTQPVQWLWQQRIPLGAITLLDGDPGTGTSLLAITIAACTSSGHPMPDGTPVTQGNVILIAPHDNASTTIKPRLEAAGGNPSHVLLLNTVESVDTKAVKISDRPFSLPDDLDLLEEAITRINATLVIIDPFGISRPGALRTTLPALAHLAQRTNCAIVLVRPLNTRHTDTSLAHPAGPPDLTAIARHALLLLPDPDDQHRHLLITTKHSLSSQPATLAYQIIENDQAIPTIHWLDQTHAPLSTLLHRPVPPSSERQHILHILHNSPTPLSPLDIAQHTGQHYTTVRQTLRRMYSAHELASPARGQYTTLDHPTIQPPSQLSQLSQTTDPSSDLSPQPLSQPLQTADPPSDLLLQQVSQPSQIENQPSDLLPSLPSHTEVPSSDLPLEQTCHRHKPQTHHLISHYNTCHNTPSTSLPMTDASNLLPRPVCTCLGCLL